MKINTKAQFQHFQLQLTSPHKRSDKFYYVITVTNNAVQLWKSDRRKSRMTLICETYEATTDGLLWAMYDMGKMIENPVYNPLIQI